jgi:hypothetical protein
MKGARAVSFWQNLPLEGGLSMKRKRFSVEQIVVVLKQAKPARAWLS